MYFGHEEIVSQLTGELPPVSIFIGPDSVGKETLAEKLANARIGPDFWYDRPVYFLDGTETASSIVDRSRVAPRGDQQIIVIAIDRYSKKAMFNVLLLALEDHPETTKFILISERDLPETIMTRGQVFRFGLLSADDLTNIIMYKKKVQEPQARAAAESGRGQVNRAFDALYRDMEKVRVLGVLRAFRERDVALLDKCSDTWTDGDTRLLGVWAREAITGRWRVFSQAESEIPGKMIPLRILMALRSTVRPRLVIRSNLMEVLKSL